MSHTRHHRRHHTWPHCGSELCMLEPRGLDLHVSKPGTGPANYIQRSFPQATAVPFITEDMLGDDTEMAGIVRPSKRMTRLWFRSSKVRNEGIQLSASPVDTRKNIHRGVLRRLIRRPPLNKTQSLLVVPSNMAADPSVMSALIRPQGLVPLSPGSDRGRSTLTSVDAAKFVAERRHRRCHSEQPRAWRRPSATLWTLQESGE
ncbi:uncharacterized protein N7511_001689 [Penicillium nucicola]|uniref:uncharacterized protein n=1 Tax=Penicillium nucicola TaxID=1850975 RepID=UPI002545895A|nr:uncharacterized protein N7511_001689 [Penicillium nucicola]KAJ5776678.1 hypothetical protein N7511_001689 [Penicillium nucicola]